MSGLALTSMYKKATGYPQLLVAAAWLALSVRLFRFASKYSVNVLFWDQWDYLEPFFRDGSIFEKFWKQHGPHRQGLGALVIHVVYSLTAWNTRSEAFVVAAILCISSALALWIKLRVTGHFEFLDVSIPLVFLSLRGWETLAGTVNPAHGSLPLLLVIAFSLAQTFESPVARVGTGVCAAVLAIFTGFGLFMGLVAPLVLLLELFRAKRLFTRALASVGLVVVLGAFACFFIGYVFQPAVACFVFPDPHPERYVRFFGAMLLQRTGFIDLSFRKWPSVALAYAAVAALVFLFAAAVRASIRGDVSGRIVAIVTGFAGLFGVNATVGRVCLGFEGADASRYAPYISLVWFGAYMWLAARKGYKTVYRGVAVALVFLLVVCERFDNSLVGSMAASKRNWARCYLEKRDLSECDGTAIYPNPAATHLREKLDFLEARHLNLFRSPP